MSTEDVTPGPTDTHRFFRTASDIHEMVRAGMDAEFGHPKNGTATCLWPADSAEAVKDAQGRVYVALTNDQAAWPEVADQITDLLAAGYAEEVTRAGFESARGESSE